ncbi:V/A-type H+-transporting ATPase subunit D [Methanocalculus alkaliphilus]|uniref:V-type ATP synthase subunit D n=1 Tax=Methanocalculus alkaliphilus TaxID=768730 RepID=UPI0020A1387A|nr:V-type ATP synthase subunit D [Methanocalculus alkaliphilus]MCP1714640.1 V/A-type H+-transporting ATPase subunit D [Methanocalculus alkaliphilus]
MEQVHPTRMELIRIKTQIKLAEQGKELLRQKMDALIAEFFQIMRGVSESREKLERVDEAARHSLHLAHAVDDSVALKSAALATRSGIALDISGKNIMGVPVPVIEKRKFSRRSFERGYGILGVSGRIDEVAEHFEAELDLIIELAETETALRRLGEEIQKNRRRVNALEQIMIPDLKKQAKFIKIAIEEREREDLYRLKKMKKIIDRKKGEDMQGW